MSLRFAILGLLVDDPQTGYELQKTFDGSVGHYWQAKFQQTYQELRRLEHDGLVVSREVPRGQARKKVYEVTPAGERALDAWLDSPSGLAPIRDEFLVKVTRFDRLPVERALLRLRQYRHLHEQRLGTYRGITERLTEAGLTEHALPPRLLGRCLTLRLGIAYEEQVLAWCDWAASVLEQHAKSATPAPPTTRQPLPAPRPSTDRPTRTAAAHRTRSSEAPAGRPRRR